MEAIFLPLKISFSLTGLLALNICFLLATLTSLFLLNKYDKTAKFQPTFITMIFFVVFFQMPSVVFTETLQINLPSYHIFYTYIYLIPISCVLFLFFSKKFRQDYSPQATQSVADSSLFRMAFFSIVVLAIFLAAFFYIIGPRCTGLFALLFDPEVTLLAREASTKLTKGSISTLLFGLLSNTICPLVVGISLHALVHDKKQNKIFAKKIFYFSLILIALITTLIPGAKGGILPIGISTLTLCLFLINDFKFKVIAFFTTIVFITLTLISFEIVKERQLAKQLVKYDYGYCAKRSNACAAANDLLLSLKHRSNSLGFSDERLKELQDSLTMKCELEAGILPSTLDFKAPPTDIDPKYLPYSYSSGLINNVPPFAQRSFVYFEAIIYRVIVTPFQVSTWHYLYGLTKKVNFFNSLPLFKFSKGYKDIPNLINIEYGAIFSGGSQVSTSTAPTTFLIAYPAYWSGFGLLFGLLCLFSFDFSYTATLRKAPRFIKQISTGLIAVICMNFMLTDFFTAMISLGGLFSIILVYVYKRISAIPVTNHLPDHQNHVENR